MTTLGLCVLCALASALPLAAGTQQWYKSDQSDRYRYATVERYQLSIFDLFNAVRLFSKSRCLEQSNCSISTRSRYFLTLLEALKRPDEDDGYTSADRTLKIILKGVPGISAVESRFVERSLDGKELQMDCVFLKDDTIVSGEFVTSQLKASLTYINEELLKNGRVTGEPIEVTSVKKLQFLELFTLAEILGAILLLLVIVGVALTAGSEAALGIVKFINQKIKKSEVVWSPVKLTEMTVRQGLAQQCMAVNQSENDEATLSHIVSETQLENSVTECGPVRPKTFKPIEEIMSC